VHRSKKPRLLHGLPAAFLQIHPLIGLQHQLKKFFTAYVDNFVQNYHPSQESN
jgi:hypothetical protein